MTRDLPFGRFHNQPVPDHRGFPQRGLQALQDLDDVVVGQARQVVVEQAGNGSVEGGQPRLDDLPPTLFESMFES